MSFLAPLFLIGVIAGIIPVILHMIHRRRAKEQPFSTLRFLQISVEQTRRRKRIHDLLLLVLRVAALVLLALALARPALTHISRLWSDRAETALVLVLDNSATMGTSDGTSSRWEKARTAAGEVLRELHDGDQVAILLTGGRPFTSAARFDPTQETIRQILAEAKLSYEKADLGAALTRARAMLDKMDAANKSIFVVTDLQAASWPEVGDEKKKPMVGSSIPVVVVDCRSASKAPNVAISDVEVSTTVPLVRLPFLVTVELFNTSGTESQRHVEIYLDEALRETSPAIKVPPGGRVKFSFTLDVEKRGEHRGKVRLVGDDASKLDDERFFAVSVGREVPVAILQSEPHEIDYLDDTFYLSSALGARKKGSGASPLGIEVTRLTVADLDGQPDKRPLDKEPLDRYRAVFCVNLPAPDAPLARRLANYVAKGGNLIWIAGRQVDPDAYNRMNELQKNLGEQLLPGVITAGHDAQLDPDRDSWHLAELNEAAPATADFAKTPPLFRSVLVYRYLGIESKDAIPLARLDNGDVLLCQRDLGEGSVWWLGTSVHIDWTNLPLRPIFMPFWVRLVHGLSTDANFPTSTIAGQPLRMPIEADGVTEQVELRPPSGELSRVAVDKSLKAKIFEYPETYQVGIYTLTPLNTSKPENRIFCVNLDPAELDDTSLDRELLEKQLDGAPLLLVKADDSPANTFTLLRSGIGLWRFFLISVLVILVFETYWANRQKTS